nr:hypothetical protein [Candidatus Karelsulcia muelleri]
MPNYIPLFRNVELKFLNVIFNLADLFIFLGVIIFCLFLPRLDLNQRPPD